MFTHPGSDYLHNKSTKPCQVALKNNNNFVKHVARTSTKLFEVRLSNLKLMDTITDGSGGGGGD